MRKIDQLIKLVISFLMMLAIAGCVPASEAPPRLFHITGSPHLNLHPRAPSISLGDSECE
jgi:hypothetical protein